MWRYSHSKQVYQLSSWYDLLQHIIASYIIIFLLLIPAIVENFHIKAMIRTLCHLIPNMTHTNDAHCGTSYLKCFSRVVICLWLLTENLVLQDLYIYFFFLINKSYHCSCEIVFNYDCKSSFLLMEISYL